MATSMSISEAGPHDAALADCARRLTAALEDPDAVSDASLQNLFASVARLHALKSGDLPIPAFGARRDVTANYVMIAATAMLRAVNVQVFELAMWQSFSGANRD